mgnify:FL=1
MKDFDLRKYLAEGRLLKENIQDEDLLSDINTLKVAIAILKKFKVSVKDKDLIKYLDTSINTYLGEPLSILKNGKKLVDDDVSSIIQGVADGLDRDKPSSDSLRRDLEKLSLAEGRLLKEDMSLTMDELEKLANLKSDEFKSSPKKLVDMVMGSVKFNLEKDGTNIENASEDEIDKLRYKWARLKGLLKVKDTFTSMYGKRGVKTNTDKDLLDKIKE